MNRRRRGRWLLALVLAASMLSSAAAWQSHGAAVTRLHLAGESPPPTPNMAYEAT